MVKLAGSPRWNAAAAVIPTLDCVFTIALRRRLIWVLLVLVAVAVFLLWRARGQAARTVLVERRDLEQHIVASGRVRVPTRVKVAAQLSGLVVAVGAVAGQRVKQGDLLVQLDDSAERAAVAQAEAAVKQAQRASNSCAGWARSWRPSRCVRLRATWPRRRATSRGLPSSRARARSRPWS